MTRFLLAFLFLSAPLFAQSESVFMLSGPTGQGSGVIVHKCEDRADKAGNCLALGATAYHVLVNDRKELVRASVFEGYYQNGQVAGNVAYANGNQKIDLALVWLIAPPTVRAVPIADTEALLPVVNEEFEVKPEPGRLARFVGFASGKLKETRGRPSFRYEGILQSDAIVMPGQSGGAMFIEDKLAGVVCGGMDWFENKGRPTVTWPTRCADAKQLKPMIEECLKTLKPKSSP